MKKCSLFRSQKISDYASELCEDTHYRPPNRFYRTITALSGCRLHCLGVLRKSNKTSNLPENHIVAYHCRPRDKSPSDGAGVGFQQVEEDQFDIAAHGKGILGNLSA